MRYAIFLLSLCFSSFTLGSDLKETQKISFVFESKANPPYYMDNSELINWNKPGITLELLKSLEDKLNIEISFKRLPWLRGLEEVRKNKIEGIFHASYNADRTKIGVYPTKSGKPDESRKIMSQSYFLYKKKDSQLSWDGTKMANLEGSIGAIHGYAIVKHLQEKGIAVESVSSQWSNLMKLSSGRIAGLAGIENMIDSQIKANPAEFENIIKVYPQLTTKSYFLMLSHQFVKENPILSEAIWDELKEMRTNGEFDKIANKYL